MHKTTVISKGSESPLVTAGKGELKQPALQKSLPGTQEMLSQNPG